MRPDPNSVIVAPRVELDFASPEHRASVLEGELLSLYGLAAEVVNGAREMPLQGGMHAVCGHKVKALRQELERLGPAVRGALNSRDVKADLFGRPVQELSEPRLDWLRTLEVPE